MIVRKIARVFLLHPLCGVELVYWGERSQYKYLGLTRDGSIPAVSRWPQNEAGRSPSEVIMAGCLPSCQARCKLLLTSNFVSRPLASIWKPPRVKWSESLSYLPRLVLLLDASATARRCKYFWGVTGTYRALLVHLVLFTRCDHHYSLWKSFLFTHFLLNVKKKTCKE